MPPDRPDLRPVQVRNLVAPLKPMSFHEFVIFLATQRSINRWMYAVFCVFLEYIEKSRKNCLLCFSPPGRLPFHEIEGCMQRFACFLKTREKARKTDFLCFSSPGRLPCHEIEGRIKRFACFLASPRSAKMRLFRVFALSGENPPSNIEGCMQPFACFSSFRDHAFFC